MRKIPTFLVVITTLMMVFGSGLTVSAEVKSEYKLLAPIPLDESGVPVREPVNAPQYIKGIFILVIGAASVLAVLKIIAAGIKYMTTEAYGAKGEAREDINKALLGLMLALGAWLILATIDKSFVELNLDITPLEIKGDFETNLGAIPGSPEATKAQKEAVGCEENCAPVPVQGSEIGTIPPKGPGPRGVGSSGCDSALVSVCYLDTELYRDLQNLTKNMAGVEWQVTELYPPTVDHKHACQNIGTAVRAMCVDASIANLECANNPECPFRSNHPRERRLADDAKKIQTFFEESDKIGLYAVYEVADTTRLEQIRSRLPQSLRSRVVAPGIKFEHFSVYRDYAVYSYKGN